MFPRYNTRSPNMRGFPYAMRVLPRILLSLLLVLASGMASAFVAKDIRVEGLQRISAGTVFNYLPVRPGDDVNAGNVPQIVRALYKTGFFKDVRLWREGDVLVIDVLERPSVARIDISGNKSIKTKDLKKGLKQAGLAEGRTFNRSLLAKIEQELRRQYFNQGKYGIELKTRVSPLERNRVAISIDIVEGKTARIRGVSIVGNKSFSDKQLLKLFKSRPGGWLSWLTKEDRYSRQKLAGDLEALKSFYLDRGYLKFKVNSTQVSLSPDKKDIYITIDVDEGDVYTLSDIRITGNLVVDAAEYFPLIHLHRGQPFSRRAVVDSTDRITAKLAEMGYAFANVNNIPEVDEEKKRVSITFYLDPGKRVYVRRIIIKGNTRTRDRVIRREMRQMESAWLSTTKLKLSRERIMRLGFFKDVNLETPAVPGTTDMADVVVTVKEKPSGSLAGGIGYSQVQGISFTASISEDNFLGTGKKVVAAVNTSKYNSRYQLSYFNPYATINGVSRGYNLSYQKTNFKELNISSYSTNRSEASVTYGVPISDFNRLTGTFGLEWIDLFQGTGAPIEIQDFVAREGDRYFNLRATFDWSHDSRDSAIFPTSGTRHTATFTLTLPGSDLQFYKFYYTFRHYTPLYRKLVFATKADLGFGGGYGKTGGLPFFEHYFAGGIGDVRGFRTNTLGPKDDLGIGNPFGGNRKLAGGIELYMPPPYKKFEKTLRLSAFLDAGNVFKDKIKWSGIRYSAGVGLTWLSPMGALTISYGVPLNDKPGDQIERFQFSLGSVF